MCHGKAQAVALRPVAGVPLIELLKDMAAGLGVHTAALVSDSHNRSALLAVQCYAYGSVLRAELGGIIQQIQPDLLYQRFAAVVGAGASSASNCSGLSRHFCRVTRMHWRSCSSSEKSVQSVRMVCASIRFKSSTLPESCASRLLSSRMICRYSRCSSGVTSSSSSRSAKPLMLTMGVLNSWEKLFTKSLRSSSVPESSSAALLKAALNSRISVAHTRGRRAAGAR